MFVGNSTKNLIKTEFTEGEITTNYTYNFDSNGKVTKQIATTTSGEVNQTNFSWTCK
jgi:hypothetical protein